MSDETKVPQTKPLSYRDLLLMRADGEPVTEYQLELWRREEELIRAAAFAPQAFRACGIKVGHFGAWLHQLAWRALSEMLQQEPELIVADPIVLWSTMKRLDEEGIIAMRSGRPWVDALMGEPPIPPPWALRGVVKELKQNVRLKAWASRMSGLTGRVGVDTNFSALQADFSRQGLEMTLEAQSDVTSGKAISEAEWDASTAAMVSVVRTGIPQIDEAAGGGHGRGELMAIGGGTNHGKSYLALDLCRRQALAGGRVLYITAEDPQELVFCRLLSTFCEPRCTPVSIRIRRSDPAIVMAAIARMKEQIGDRFFVEEAKKPDVEKVCDLIRLHRWTNNIDMVVVDYVQAITCEEASKGNKVQEVSAIVTALKKCATECGVALVLLSQYARDQYKDGSEPTVNSFKYCGDIENESEIVLLLWKDGAGTLHVKIPKVKWAKADELRYIIPTDPVNGWPMEWEDDFGSAGGEDD